MCDLLAKTHKLWQCLPLCVDRAGKNENWSIHNPLWNHYLICLTNFLYCWDMCKVLTSSKMHESVYVMLLHRGDMKSMLPLREGKKLSGAAGSSGPRTSLSGKNAAK